MTIEYDVLTLLKTGKYQFNEIHKELKKPDSLISRILTDLVKKRWVIKTGTKATGGVYYSINEDSEEVRVFMELPIIYHQRDKVIQRYAELTRTKDELAAAKDLLKKYGCPDPKAEIEQQLIIIKKEKIRGNN